MSDTSFSTRYGYVPRAHIRPESRMDVPHALRSLVAESAKRWGIAPTDLRKFTWTCLKKDIGPEEKDLWVNSSRGLSDAPWYRVYDIIEAVLAAARESDAHVEQLPILADETYPKAPGFEQDINDYLIENGIPWQLVSGEIVTRGEEAFETGCEDRASRTRAGRADHRG